MTTGRCGGEAGPREDLAQGPAAAPSLPSAWHPARGSDHRPVTQVLDQAPVGNAWGAAAAPRPSVPRPWPLTEGPGTKAGPELARGQVWGHTTAVTQGHCRDKDPS